MSSYSRSREIAETLKGWIEAGEFQLTQAVAPLPGRDSDIQYHTLVERPAGEDE